MVCGIFMLAVLKYFWSIISILNAYYSPKKDKDSLLAKSWGYCRVFRKPKRINADAGHHEVCDLFSKTAI